MLIKKNGILSSRMTPIICGLIAFTIKKTVVSYLVGMMNWPDSIKR